MTSFFKTSGTNKKKKHIIKSNNTKILWTLLMSLICCVVAGHSSYLISQTARITKAWGVSRSTFCISTIFLLTNVSFNKNRRAKMGLGGKPTRTGLELRQFTRKWKSRIVCGKYQNHHNHLSHRDLYLHYSSDWISVASRTHCFRTFFITLFVCIFPDTFVH